jgi:hypothetical protein
MCCVKVLGKMEIEFNGDIFDQFKGSPISIQLRTHDGGHIGAADYRICLKHNAIVLTFDKPKDDCCVG